MARPLTKSTGREEYGQSVERSPCSVGPLTGDPNPANNSATLNSTVTGSDTAALITAITNANSSNMPTTITLPVGSLYDFTSANNTTNGANALPVITGNITIIGNNDTIERTGATAFRLFDVGPGASLTLKNLTLQGGLAQGTGVAAVGGAVYSSGTLKLMSVTVQNNEALGSNGATGGSTTAGDSGANALGGGLYVAGGSVTLSNATVKSNLAQGGNGGLSSSGHGRVGGTGSGGGLYVASGNLTLTNATLNNNMAQGGQGGQGRSSANGGNGGNGGTGGNGSGGGLDMAGNATLTNDTFTSNTAQGGTGGSDGDASSRSSYGGHGGNGSGGGLDMAGNATLTNDTFTSNTAQGGTGGSGFYGSNSSNGNGGNGGNGTGGGLNQASGSVTLTNNTIFGNQAQGGTGGQGGSDGSTGIGGNGGNGGNGTGGGVELISGSTAVLANTLIALDIVTAGVGGMGGIGANANGSPGSPGSAYGPDVSGNVSSSDHDLIGDGSGSYGFSSSNGDQVGTDSNPINPLLGPLQNNGGPTQTQALLPGSPAIDAGDSNAAGLPSKDQRGFARKIGNAVDIGAVEYQYDLAVTGSAPAAATAGQTIAYSITVKNNGPDIAGNGGGVVLTDVLPSGVTFVSLVAPSGWTTSNQNGTITASIATLASGASASFTLTVQTSSSTPPTLHNTVTVGPTTWDNKSSNNSLTFTTSVVMLHPTGVDIHGQPSNTVVGRPISPAVLVAVVDANGNTITTDNSQLVTLSIYSGPKGAKLEGTTTVRAEHGVARFTNLRLTVAGTYILKATGGKLTPDFSNSFRVLAAGQSVD